MSIAQQQSQQIDALFARFEALNAKVEEFKAAYMTQANPTVQTVQEPVDSFVAPTVAERFESVQDEAAAVNDFVSNINIDDLLGDINLDAYQEPSQPVEQEPVQPAPDANIDIDALLADIDLDGITL